MAVNLQEFLDGYKKCEIVYGDKKWVFREPKVIDLKLGALELLEKYCIEWDFAEFKKYLLIEIPNSQQKPLLDKIMTDLGLV